MTEPKKDFLFFKEEVCGAQLFFNHLQGRWRAKAVKLHHVGFRLNARKEFLTVSVVKHWFRLLKKALKFFLWRFSKPV